MRHSGPSKIIAGMCAVSLAQIAGAKSEGPVVAYFYGQPADAAAEIATTCINKNIIVAEQDDRHVLCSREVTGLSGIFTQLLIGNSYSTTPVQVIRFSITQGPGYSIVQSVAWVETQMAFGQMQRMQLDNRKHVQSIRDLLHSAGGQDFPPRPQTQPVPNAQPSTVETPGSAAMAADAAPVKFRLSVPPAQSAQTPPAPQPQPEPSFGNSHVKCVTCR